MPRAQAFIDPRTTLKGGPSGAQAAAVIGARLAGVDIITPDPSISLDKSGGVVLEVNTTPGYYYHYHRRGGPVPVACAILECLLKADRYSLGPDEHVSLGNAAQFA